MQIQHRTQTTPSFKTPFNATQSKLGRQVVDAIILGNSDKESKVRQFMRVTLCGAGVLISFGSLFPNMKVALSLEGVYGTVTAIGVAVDFGILGSWGVISMVNKIFQKSISNTHNKNWIESMCKTSGMIAISVAGGISARLPTAGVALVVAPDIPLASRVPIAMLSVFGKSWTTSYSVYETLNYIEKTSKSISANQDYQKIIQIIQNNLEACFHFAQEESLLFTPETRRTIFPSFYNPSESDYMEMGTTRLSSIFHETISYSKDQNRPTTNSLNSIGWPKKGVEWLSSIAPALLLVQNTLLTKTAFDFFTPNYNMAKWLISGTLASTFTWAGFKYCTQTAGTLFERYITLGCSERPKTFGERFYPITTAILQLMTLIFSILPHGEIVTVAKYYVDPNTLSGLIFMEANFMASFLLIVNAFEDLFEGGLLHISESRWASPDIQEAVALYRKLGQIKQVIQNSHLPELSEMLDEIDTEDLKRLFKTPNISVREIKEAIKQYTDI